MEAHLRRAIDCGVAAYVTKCDAPSDLAAAIHKVLAGGLFLPDLMPAQHLPPSARTTVGNGPHGLSSLTRREIEVLTRLAEGLRVSEVARVLSISPNTVENHKAHVMRKLGLHKNVDLARFAIRHGWCRKNSARPAPGFAAGRTGQFGLLGRRGNGHRLRQCPRPPCLGSRPLHCRAAVLGKIAGDILHCSP